MNEVGWRYFMGFHWDYVGDVIVRSNDEWCLFEVVLLSTSDQLMVVAFSTRFRFTCLAGFEFQLGFEFESGYRSGKSIKFKLDLKLSRQPPGFCPCSEYVNRMAC